LVFVMCAALALTFPYFQLLAKCLKSPMLTTNFSLPSCDKEIDWDLMVGAMLFGIGWGLCGMCPGPLWVIAVARPSLSTLVCSFGVVLGMGVWTLREHSKNQDFPKSSVEPFLQLDALSKARMSTVGGRCSALVHARPFSKNMSLSWPKPEG